MDKSNITTKQIEELMDELEGEEMCKYCLYNDDCPRGVVGGPNGPIYPPCSDGLKVDDFDYEAYLADKEDICSV